MMAINWHSPWVIGGIGLGVVLLLVAMRGGGGGSATTTSLVAADQTNAQLATLSTGLSATQMGYASQLAITQANNGAAEAIAADQTGYGMWAALLSVFTNQANNQTAIATNDANVNGSIANHAISADATLRLAPQLATIQADSNQALASIAAGAAVTTTSMNDNAYVAVAPTLAQISASNQQALATISGNTAAEIAGINQSGATNRQLASSGGSILSGAGGLLSGIGGLFGGGAAAGGGASAIADVAGLALL